MDLRHDFLQLIQSCPRFFTHEMLSAGVPILLRDTVLQASLFDFLQPFYQIYEGLVPCYIICQKYTVSALVEYPSN